jgi:translation initiation factor 5B
LTLKSQSQESINDYENKLQKIILELNTKGYNAALYWENNDPIDYISLVPTSGVTGEGIPDLLSVIVKYSLTLDSITKRIRVKEGKFLCTVMEVKMIEGYGTTIDCMLVDGCIKKDDQIVILGFEGPIVTKVKAILTPHPMKEMRIKDEYLHHREIWGANGVKIAATGLDNAVAGTPLIVVHNEDEIEDAKAIVMNELENVKKKIKL